MKALTIKQPWAHLIAHESKRIENRSWPTRYRGVLLIHAGKAFDQGALDHPGVRGVPGQDVRGAVIAVAQLVGCHPDDGRCTEWSVPGEWHWELDEVRPPPEPVPCKGRLGLWVPPQDVLDAVLTQDTGVAW